MDRIIHIKLFDRAYAFRANAETAQVEEIAQYVVSEVEKAKASGEMPTKLETVILAALNIAGECFEAKRLRQKLFEDVQQRSGALIEYIDSNV